jgi:hypothetical protein
MLADRIAPPDGRTKFEKWLDALSPKHRAIVDGWMLDPNTSNIAIINAIRDDDEEDAFKGIRVDRDAFAKYRKRLHGA